jgi:hypothetical protein
MSAGVGKTAGVEYQTSLEQRYRDKMASLLALKSRDPPRAFWMVLPKHLQA